MPRAHIGGDSGQQFWDLVGPVDPRRVLLVGIDVSKPSWFVLGSDLIGEVVLDGAKLMADAAGLEQLVVLLHDTRRRLNAQVVVVGVEATGTSTRRWRRTCPTSRTSSCGWSTRPRSRRSARRS
jgi:hypothetical protein